MAHSVRRRISGRSEKTYHYPRWDDGLDEEQRRRLQSSFENAAGYGATDPPFAGDEDRPQR